MLLRSIVHAMPLTRRYSSVARWSAAAAPGLESDGLTIEVYAAKRTPAVAAASIAA